MAQNGTSFASRYRLKDAAASGAIDDSAAIEYMKKVIKKSKTPKGSSRISKRDEYTPAIMMFSPSRYLGATSEKFAEKTTEYLKTNPDGLLKGKKGEDATLKPTRKKELMSGKTFQALMNIKYMRSLVEPGEAVGLLASQGFAFFPREDEMYY
jgi:DNA-directed RNA polymerase I subunit RPA1